MGDSLRLTVIVYALGIAAICAAFAVSGRTRPPTVTGALVMLEVGAIGQALLDVVAVARGRHGASLGTHLAYLAASLVVVPLFAASVRLHPRRYGSTALAVGGALFAVVSLRLDQTLGRA